MFNVGGKIHLALSTEFITLETSVLKFFMVAKLASVVKIQSIHLVFKKIEERFTCNLIQFEKKAVAPKVIFFLPLFPSCKNCMHNKVWGYAEISTKTLD